jgi:hypothetical protein
MIEQQELERLIISYFEKLGAVYHGDCGIIDVKNCHSVSAAILAGQIRRAVDNPA